MQKDIRFTCSVSHVDISFINTVDLYTMLGNALDNAIEAVEKVEDPEKKIIDFSVEEKATCLYFVTQNYYSESIVLRDGLPQTTKGDKERHGMGLSSIRHHAEKYGGDLRISADGEIFRMQLVIPIAS